MPRKTGKAGRIMKQSAAEISELSDKEAREQYDYLRKVIKEREKGFQHADKQGKFDRQYGITGIPSLRGMSEKDVKKQIKRMINQLSGEQATITGVQKALERANNKRKSGLERILGRELSDKEYDRIGRFLGEMQRRHKEMWKYVSDDYIEIIDDDEFDPDDYQESLLEHQAERLGLQREQFLKNYDYWLAHASDLTEASPITGRKGKLYPSAYIEQLGLPTIKKWREMQ